MCDGCYQKKDGDDKKLKNGDAKLGSGRTIPLKQVTNAACNSLLLMYEFISAKL